MSEDMKTFTFWRNLALYFMLFSFVGHWIEMLAALVARSLLKEDFGYGILSNFIEPYTIYGLGAVVCVLLTRPVVKKVSKNLAVLYLASVLACAVVEYVSALIVVARFGHNPFWDYSDMPLNLNGYICLRNTLVFGVIATVFVAFIYPLLNKLLKKLGSWRANYIFALVLALFAVCIVAYWK